MTASQYKITFQHHFIIIDHITHVTRTPSCYEFYKHEQLVAAYRQDTIYGIEQLHAAESRSGMTAGAQWNPHVHPAESSTEILKMVHRNNTYYAYLDMNTKQYTIKKDTLIARKETKSLIKAPNKQHIRDIRSKLLSEQCKPYNDTYSKLAQDITLDSITLVTCILTGAILSPKAYWRQTYKSPAAVPPST